MNPDKHYLGTLCKRGHDYNGTGKSVRYVNSNQACVMCSKISNGKRWKRKTKCTFESKTRVITYKEVKTFFAKHKCKLLSKEYNNVDSKLDFICSCGKEYSTTLWRFRSMKSCGKCVDKKRAEKRRHSYNYVKKKFLNNGYKLLSTSYKDCNDKLKYKCTCGKICYISVHNLRKRKTCKCEKLKWTYDKVKQIVGKDGNILLTNKNQYKSCTDKIDYICKCGNHSKTIFSSYIKNNRICPKCTNLGKGIVDGEYGIYINNPEKYKSKWYHKNRLREVIDYLKNKQDFNTLEKLEKVIESYSITSATRKEILENG